MEGRLNADVDVDDGTMSSSRELSLSWLGWCWYCCLLQTHAGYFLALLVVCLAIAVDGEGDGGRRWSWGELVVQGLVELCWLGTCG